MYSCVCNLLVSMHSNKLCSKQVGPFAALLAKNNGATTRSAPRSLCSLRCTVSRLRATRTGRDDYRCARASCVQTTRRAVPYLFF